MQPFVHLHVHSQFSILDGQASIKAIVNKVTITETVDTTYKYEISYEIYICFDNNLDKPQDGPYGFVQFMSYTPDENTNGYENSTTITKDNSRILWTDKCDSCEIRRTGVIGKDGFLQNE